MKLSCGIVKDLLPLYEEEICSEDSKKSVEEHLKQCRECAAFYEKLHSPLEEKIAQELFPDEMGKEEEAIAQKEEQERRIIKKGLHKIRSRWIASIIALLMIFPIAGVSVVSCYHEKKKEGICFSNIDDILLARKFVMLLENGEYEKAAKMQNAIYRWRYGEIQRNYKKYSEIEEEKRSDYEKWYLREFAKDVKLTEDEFVEEEQKDFVESMQAYEKIGTISGFEVDRVYYHNEHWDMEVSIKEKIKGDDTEWVQKLTMYVEDDGTIACLGLVNKDSGYEKYESKGIIYAIGMCGNYGPY